MEINYILIFITAVIYFALGAVWYSPLMFGKWWMEIMETTDKSQEEMQKMQKEMTPAYIAQFVVSLVTITILTFLIQILVNLNLGFHAYGVAGLVWLGFVLPIIVGNVIWSQTKKKFWYKQIFVSASYQLVAFMITAFLLTIL